MPLFYHSVRREQTTLGAIFVFAADRLRAATIAGRIAHESLPDQPKLRLVNCPCRMKREALPHGTLNRLLTSADIAAFFPSEPPKLEA